MHTVEISRQEVRMTAESLMSRLSARLQAYSLRELELDTTTYLVLDENTSAARMRRFNRLTTAMNNVVHGTVKGTVA